MDIKTKTISVKLGGRAFMKYTWPLVQDVTALLTLLRSVFYRIVVSVLILLFDFNGVSASVPNFTLNVPASAEYGEIITVTSSTSGGSEGISLSYDGLLLLRGWHDHCGYCGDSCLVGDEIKSCSDCCYFGCYSTQCSWWWEEFSDTWFGPPTIQFLVTGCGEATISCRYLGDSHEGPFTTSTYTIKILGGVEANMASATSEACVDENVSFDASATCGAAEFSWNFGDGGTGTGKTGTHTYTSPGTYTVTVTATYNGYSDTADASITVKGDCALINGTVSLAADGSPLPGATVVAQGGSSTHADSTAGDGTYIIRVPGDDNYTLEAYKPGFEPETQAAVHLDYKDTHTWNASLGFEETDDTDKKEILGDQPNSVDDPVNPALGNYYFIKDLFALPGKNGMNFTFRVAYNSNDSFYDGPLGFGWTHKYNVVLDKSGDDVTIKFGDGHTEFYTYDSGTSTYIPSKSRAHITLEDRSPSGYIAELGGGVTYEFDDQGRLEKIADLNGNTLTLAHSAQLDSITDTAGRQIDFVYTNGRVTALTSPVKSENTIEFAYDANGNLLELTDPRGNAWQFTYDASHRLLTETDRKGVLALTNTYDNEGRVLEQKDALNHKTTYAYSDSAIGSRVEITPPSGNGVTHEYDRAFNLISMTDGEGKTAYFSYKKDTNGQIAGATDKAGHVMEVEADEWGQVKSVTNNLGVTTDISFNDTKQITRIADDQGKSIDLSYDSRRNLTWVNDIDRAQVQLQRNSDGTIKVIDDRAGEYWQFTYNSEGLVSEKNPVRTLNKSTSFQYDAAGRTTHVTFPDSLGSIRHSYDDNGNSVSTTSPMGHETQFVYDENDRITSRTFIPTGSTVSYEYNDLGKLVKIIDSGGGETGYTYDSDSNLLSRTDPDGITVSYEYNKRNQRVKKIAPNGAETGFSYDTNGNLMEIEDPLGNLWTTEYDSGGRIIKQTDPLGNSVTLERDLSDDELVVTDETGKITTLFHDVKKRPICVIKPDSSTRNYHYNLNGKISQVTDERKNNWIYYYDKLKRLTALKDPAGKKASMGYDARGQLTAFTNRDGETSQFEYDLDGRLTRQGLSDGSEITYDYQYNTGGTSVVTITDPAGTTTRTFDRADRLVSKTDTHGNTVSFTYTPGGRLASVTYPGHNTVAYSYDTSGRLVRITDWLSNQTSYQYDAMDRIVGVDYPNGSTTATSFNGRGNVKSISHKKAGGSTCVSYSFVRDAKGRITSSHQTSGLAPLVGDYTRSSTYDSSNRIRSTDSGDQTASYSYNNEGSLMAMGSPTQSSAYAYDSLNRLTSVTSDGVTTDYTYDAYGNRTGKTCAGIETQYLGESGRTYVSFDGTGAVLRYHIWGNGLVYSLDASGSMSVYHGDERGSVVAVTDNTGDVVRQYAYDPMGNVLADSGDGPDVFRFLGCHGIMSDENGLVFMTARYYDPRLGRFLNEDPLGAQQVENLYAYGDGDPVNRIDPSGTQTIVDAEVINAIEVYIEYGVDLAIRDVGHFVPVNSVVKVPGSEVYITEDLMTTYFSERYTAKEIVKMISKDCAKYMSKILPRPETAEAVEAATGSTTTSLMTTLTADTATLSTGTVLGGVMVAGAVGWEGGRAFSENVPVGHDPVTGEEGATMDTMMQWSFGRGGFWGDYYKSNDDPYLVANAWLRELLDEMGLSYSDYLKIAAEFTKTGAGRSSVMSR